ncbi:MAG: hypothetical protein H0Z35_07985 [Thermoanaerobacteraceae bacterium]|nr:hypothetical protein [Thermoanaerobacteraceae bacterium]
MNRPLHMLLVVALVFLLGGCTVSQEEYSGTVVVTPLQIETFIFQTEDIQKEYMNADKQCEEAIEKLLNGEYDKFETNAVLLHSGDVIKGLIKDTQEVEAPGKLQSLRDDLNFSLVYYLRGIEKFQAYLDTEDQAVLNEAQEQFARADQFLENYRNQRRGLVRQQKKSEFQ